MDYTRQIGLKEDLTRYREALGMLQSALMADSMMAHPCKALSRDVINESLVHAGLEPIIDREVTLI